jgi:hypothetical protein
MSFFTRTLVLEKMNLLVFQKKLRDYEGMTEIIKEFGRVKKENRQQSKEV